MPRVRRPLTHTTAAAAAGRVVAPSNASGADAEPAEKPQCSVCFEDLEKKRSVKIKSCKHPFHRTCCIAWVETRETRVLQSCPLCRKRVYDILDEKNKPIEPLIAFGSTGQPTKTRVFRAASDLKEPNVTNAVKWLVEKNEKDMKTVLDQQRLAKSEKREAVYTEDIKTELEKLTKRREIYNEMLEVCAAGRMVDDRADIDFVDLDDPNPEQWDMMVEMRMDAINFVPDYSNLLTANPISWDDDEDEEDDEDYAEEDENEEEDVEEEEEEDLERDIDHERLLSYLRNVQRSIRDRSPLHLRGLYPPPGPAARAARTPAARSNRPVAQQSVAAASERNRARQRGTAAAAAAPAAAAATAASAATTSASRPAAQTSRSRGRAAAAAGPSNVSTHAAAGPSGTAAAAAPTTDTRRSTRKRTATQMPTN